MTLDRRRALHFGGFMVLRWNGIIYGAHLITFNVKFISQR